MAGNIWSIRTYCFAAHTMYTFGGVARYPDGGFKIRTKQFTIKNVDGTARLLFSFGDVTSADSTAGPDGTTYQILNPGGSAALEVNVDRFFVKANVGDASCQFQVETSLRSGWNDR
jgi:hypothetical protein